MQASRTATTPAHADAALTGCCAYTHGVHRCLTNAKMSAPWWCTSSSWRRSGGYAGTPPSPPPPYARGGLGSLAPAIRGRCSCRGGSSSPTVAAAGAGLRRARVSACPAVVSLQARAAGRSLPPRLAHAGVVGDTQCRLHDAPALCSQPVRAPQHTALPHITGKGGPARGQGRVCVCVGGGTASGAAGSKAGAELLITQLQQQSGGGAMWTHCTGTLWLPGS